MSISDTGASSRGLDIVFEMGILSPQQSIILLFRRDPPIDSIISGDYPQPSGSHFDD